MYNGITRWPAANRSNSKIELSSPPLYNKPTDDAGNAGFKSHTLIAIHNSDLL